MAKAEVMAGNCGFTTQIDAKMNGNTCELHISSECKAIERMAAEITEVNPYKEISFKRAMPIIHEAGVKHCTHAACPVPVSIIKAVEVEAGLALPTDVVIKLSK
ncbi:MAG: DUF6951 family protein [Anaerolineales bacterium]|jgi:hypothetical protein